jgi:hypothetical protein
MYEFIVNLIYRNLINYEKVTNYLHGTELVRSKTI